MLKVKSRKRILAVVLLLIAALYFSRHSAWNAFCSFLVVQDDLEKADVIVVLGGGSGERTLQAVDLYKRGYAPSIMVCGGKGVWRFTWGEVMTDLAVEEGVPRDAIIVEDLSMTTFENARNARSIAEERGFTSVIVVSSPYHMRRVSLLFRKAFKGSGISLLFYPVQKGILEEVGFEDRPELQYYEGCKLLYSWKLFLPWSKPEIREKMNNQ